MLDKTQQKIYKDLQIPYDYAEKRGLLFYSDATDLVDVGQNIFGLSQYLSQKTALAWEKMVLASSNDDISLMIISGFRSFEYQTSLITKKLKKGSSIKQILRVNAPPGYSQHHAGIAIDIGTPDSRPLTEEFEKSMAFDWLVKNAKYFGFCMTYHRDNKYGFMFEPWHWALKE